MKKIISIMLLTSFSTTAFAQSIESPVSVSESVVSPMSKGKPAPFEGLLLSPSAVAEIIAEKSTADEKCKISVDSKVKECKANSTFELKEYKAKMDTTVSSLEADITQKQSELKILDKKLKDEISNRPNTMMWGAVGFLAGASVTFLSIFGISQIAK